MTETYYLNGEAYNFDTQEELDAWLAENPTASKTNHATVEKMKKDVGWGFVEKDFVNNMNTYYKNTGIEFKEATAGKDRFVMYDADTDETSEAFDLPNIFSTAGKTTSWDDVNLNVRNFFDRDRTVSKEFASQKEKVTNVIAAKLDDVDFLTNLLGENFDFSYVEKLEKGGKGEDYEIVMQALKNQVGKFGGFFGGDFETDVDFSLLSEQSIEKIIGDAVTKKFDYDKAIKSNEKEIELVNTITEENTTTTKIDNANRQAKINTLSKEGMALHLGLEKIKTLDPNSNEYQTQQKTNEELLREYEGWWRKNSEFLVDPITGISINPESPQAATAIVVSKEELTKTEDKIKLTYGQNIEQAFNVNGRKKWLSDKQGEETYNITVNDPQASAIFEALGYEILGDNENGYEYSVKLKDLAKYYDATVKSDGFTFLSGAKGSTVFSGKQDFGSKFTGLLNIKDKSSFKSPMGYFGLTDKVGLQQFENSRWQQLTGIDEYTPGVDLDKPFKRMLKDYRDDKFNLIKEGRVLTKMHLLNVDPASTETMLTERGAELIVEGFRGIFGGSQADIETMGSTREDKDILEGIAANSNITLTTTQTEEIKRGTVYRVYEGVTGFVPAIAEFAIIDLAIKKGTGIIPGAAKLVSKLSQGNTLQKTLYHTGGIIKEEIKMKAAFDEHYHMGGGAGFYAVGNLIPNFKSKYNLLNTFMNANKSGVGGSLSVQAAANLEALIRDVAGKESYQTWVKENYADLELTSVDMLVDYFVFTAIGAKGWAFGGGKNWKNNFKTTSRLEKLENELANKITIYKSTIANQKATGRSKEAEKTEELLKKAEELFMGVHTRLEGIYEVNDWHDPEKATKMIERQNKNIKAIFGEQVSIQAVNSRKNKEGKDLFEFEDSAAELSRDGKTIYIDVNRVQPGKLPHEVFHLTMKQMFKNNPALMNSFKATIESSFQDKMFVDVEIKDKDGKPTGKFKDMSIEELVKNEHGSQVNFDKIKANEFLAYTAEILANPRYYSKFVANGTWKKLQMDLNKFTNRHMGTSVIESGTKQDLIDFIANFSRSTLEGNLTRKQIEMFKRVKADGTFAEKIEADSRTQQRKNEEKSEEVMKTNMPSKSVELSSKTQKTYQDIVKGKEGLKLDRSIEQLTMPDPKDRSSVAGKNFDNIIYDLIERMYPEVYKNPDQRYTLALDMVYDINRGPDAKNRGVQGLIKEYEARKEFDYTKGKPDVFDSEGNKRLTKKEVEALESKYDAKFGTPEFIEKATKEGYKGKQNLTKTVREGLINRIHEIKERALGQESDLEGLGFTRSIQEMGETGRDIVDTKGPSTFEFKSTEEIKREAKGKKKINPLDYVEPKDLVSIRKNTTDYLKSTKALIDLRPEKLAEAITPETQKLFEKQFGRYKEVENKDGSITLEKVAKKDYYDISKEIFEAKEKELYEATLPESRDKYTSETTNAAKSTFAPLYKKVGEFTFAELNKGIAKEILTDSQKAEGRDKMEKEPYRKGILNDIIFKGNRKDQHHKRMDYLMPHGTFTVARKVVDMQLNNPRYVEMLKKMNPGVYEGLQLNQVLTSIRENLRGTTPEALASMKTKLVVDQFVEKIKKGQGAKAAVLEVIASNESLKPYKAEILEKMKLGVEELSTTGELFVKFGDAGRSLGIIQGKAVKPIIFDAKFDGKKGVSVYGELNKILDKFSEKGLINKDLINVNQAKSKREKDRDFSKDFAELFLPKFFESFDARLLNMPGPDRGGLGTTMGYGNQRFGYRPLVTRVSKKRGKITEPKIFDKDMRNGIFEGLDLVNFREVSTKTGKPLTNKEFKKKYFDPKFVKVNNNTDVQKAVDNALKTFEDKGLDVFNPKIRKAYVENIKKQLSPDGTLKGYNKMLEANQGMLNYISTKLFDYINNAAKSGEKGSLETAINNVSYFLQIQTNLGNGWFRGLATHNASTLIRSGNVEKTLSERYRSEHEFQLTNLTGNLLLNTLNNFGKKKAFQDNMKPLIREFKQSIISRELQKKIDDAEAGGNTANIYSEKGITTDVTAKANFLLERQIMESIVDFKTGKTYAEIIDGRLQAKNVYENLQAISKKAGLPSKNVSTANMIRNAKIRDQALESGRVKNKKARGASVFDFDETVAFSENFVFATKGKQKKKIASNEWPFVGEKLLKEGWKMDFTDFNRVTKGKPGPLMQKMKNQIEKFGPDNVFILTARAPESAKAIQDYLKSEGVKIPLKNITGLGNSTGEAKALWMLEKFSEGYNDMYFVDDALPNVKAVKEVLSQLDIKSKVQQALASKNNDLAINKIMEHSLGIESQKRFSKAEAKIRGKDIKRRRIFMRDSAADLELLIEPLYGKGKKGNENKKWFKEELVLPFERGIRDYNVARQSAKNDYMSLRKQNKDVVKIISKEVEGTSFTNDMAMRVYLWNKAGYTIPDLAKTSENKLVEHVINNPRLRAYAERFATITKQEKGLKEPGENWWAETMAGEVTNIDRGVSRKQYLQEWTNAKNEIFSEENLNKMESKLGTRWRENIEDMFDRMETGRTRSLKLDRGSSAMMNYLNGGIGTIMNFNTRSAALQTISTLNFLNMRENNPISAARAMANVPQFAKDFMFIMNSPMLKQRRDGLSINVTEAEIASAAAASPNMIQGIISKVLKVGYTPTKLADSFAISFGGATFYRNRIKMYERQGMKTKEAEKEAFLDFQVLSERTQQSSRADLLSRQQTSLIGRFILPFANTPMQMNRAGMKDILDVAKGRTTGLRNTSEAMGRIAYYMGAQVSIFAGLQSALFAMLFNDEDVTPEKIASTKTYTLQSTSDSMLRGFGIQGAFISSFKNAAIEFFKQSPKGYMADYGEITEDLLNISPPIGSKIGMLDLAGDRLKFNTKTPFKFELGNPKLEAGLMSIQAITNAPVYSPYQNITNVQHALSDKYETWQRIFMGAGWTPYNVGIEEEKKKKKKRKYEGIRLE
tara:strand:+ start:15490 stop:24321 length:8832 start_codon:yes stop_codon:yes gene_type:complete